MAAMEGSRVLGGLEQVNLKRYASVSPRAFGIVGRKRIAVIRAAGAIVGGGGSPYVRVSQTVGIRGVSSAYHIDMQANRQSVGRQETAVKLRLCSVLCGCSAGGTITAPELIAQLRQVAEQKAFVGLILRVDSPGIGCWLPSVSRFLLCVIAWKTAKVNQVVYLGLLKSD